MSGGRPAVFLDRDGVINELVWNPATEAFESPHRPEDLALVGGAVESLQRLGGAGYALFVVSNQPSYAKRKAALEDLRRIADLLEERLRSGGVRLADAYYCFHHPQAVVPELAVRCRCRKRGTEFLERARDRHGIALESSWMVGDRDSDLECGRRAGCRTIAILNPHSEKDRGKVAADHSSRSLPDAVGVLLKEDVR